MKVWFQAAEAREALRQLPEVAALESLEPPQSLAEVFVPQLHAKALHLDASIVVGMRGAGKSWWTAVLASDRHRAFVSGQAEGKVLGQATVRVGFGLDETNALFPSAHVLRSVLQAGGDPLCVWQAVVLRHALHALGEQLPFGRDDWAGAVAWVNDHAEDVDRKFTWCDERLAERGRVLLVLFDAFDRVATDWAEVRRLTSAAFRLCLRLRSRRAIRLKFFIRPDLQDDAEVWRFPDSSKLQHTAVEFTWRSTDLYGLVLTYLANSATFGAQFREATTGELGVTWAAREGVFVLPHGLMSETQGQRAVVEALADRFMGKSEKRGYTYTWVPTHLADAVGRASPRSYLLAFRRAAEHTADQFPSHEAALHYQAIQQGVTNASRIRVKEIAEDYPWVEPLLEAARGVVVPITPEELSRHWSAEELGKVNAAANVKLPPRRYSTDPFRRGSAEALIDDLVELAVLYRTNDGRLNMPDIFRVGFGIRRKGGVKPPR